jgi:hypothetical protein
MKKHILTLTMALGTFVFAMPLVSNADDGDRVIKHDGQYDTHKHYYVDKSGYWDESDHHQVYIINEGHHGYWDTKGEKRVFITVGD